VVNVGIEKKSWYRGAVSIPALVLSVVLITIGLGSGIASADSHDPTQPVCLKFETELLRAYLITPALLRTM